MHKLLTKINICDRRSLQPPPFPPDADHPLSRQGQAQGKGEREGTARSAVGCAKSKTGPYSIRDGRTTVLGGAPLIGRPYMGQGGSPKSPPKILLTPQSW